MLCSLIWIIEIFYILLNSKSAVTYFNAANKYKNSQLSSLYETYLEFGIMNIVDIIISLIFCLAITIAYTKSQDNQEDINYLKKGLKKINNTLKKTSTQSVNTTSKIESNSPTNYEDKK